MSTVVKETTVSIQAPADTTWEYIIWEYWPQALSNGMHSPVRDDRDRRLSFHYGRGSGRSEGQLVVTPVSPNSCSLHVTWRTLDVGFVVAAAMGGRSEKAVKALGANLKAGAESRATTTGRPPVGT